MPQGLGCLGPVPLRQGGQGGAGVGDGLADGGAAAAFEPVEEGQAWLGGHASEGVGGADLHRRGGEPAGGDPARGGEGVLRGGRAEGGQRLERAGAVVRASEGADEGGAAARIAGGGEAEGGGEGEVG